MPRLQALNPAAATGKAHALLTAVNNKLGFVPNMMRTMASSPAVLEGYLGLSGALSAGRLTSKLREQIALAVSEVNGCNYCLAAHTLLGKKAGLTDVDTLSIRQGSPRRAATRSASDTPALAPSSVCAPRQ